MNQDRYPFSANGNYLNYEFESDGPNGKIKKIVRFNLENEEGKTFFSLAFGDWNEQIGDLDDKIISNNNDRTKILSTVAATVLEFTSHFPDMQVYALGSTPSRTRLYQMGISANLKEIESFLHVYGWNNDNWEEFKKGVNYDGFLVERKQESSKFVSLKL